MTDIDLAIKHLKSKGIEAFDGSGILVIPCDGPDQIVDMVSIIKHHLEDIGYDKSWQINPYYYERKSSLNAEMYDGN